MTRAIARYRCDKSSGCSSASPARSSTDSPSSGHAIAMATNLARRGAGEQGRQQGRISPDALGIRSRRSLLELDVVRPLEDAQAAIGDEPLVDRAEAALERR